MPTAPPALQVAHPVAERPLAEQNPPDGDEPLPKHLVFGPPVPAVQMAALATPVSQTVPTLLVALDPVEHRREERGLMCLRLGGT